MGRPKVKIIDDSQPTAEIKDQISKIKKTDQTNEEKQSSSSTEDRHVVPQSRTSLDDKKEKSQKTGKTKPRGKKYQEAINSLDRSRYYPINEAIDLVKKTSYAKFNATLEAHINTIQTGIRGLVSLPYAKGKKIRMLVFGPLNPTIEGAVFGSDTTIEDINKGKVDFDLVVATPDWMPKLAKVARILGPRGLMPNPKNGTIADSAEGLKKTVAGFQAGKTEYEHSSKILYKTEPKAPVIHLAVGKLDQPNEELAANIKTLIQTIGKTKVKKITLSPTMGPGIKLDLSSL